MPAPFNTIILVGALEDAEGIVFGLFCDNYCIGFLFAIAAVLYAGYP